jgi:hypothetical protein
MHRVGVSAPDIAGVDESNLPAPESFRSQWPILNLRVAKGNGPQRGLHTGAVSFLDAIGRLWHPVRLFKDKRSKEEH